MYFVLVVQSSTTLSRSAHVSRAIPPSLYFSVVINKYNNVHHKRSGMSVEDFRTPSKDVEDDDGDECCPVCLRKALEVKTICTLKCRHQICVRCLKSLKKSALQKLCPLCRRSLVVSHKTKIRSTNARRPKGLCSRLCLFSTTIFRRRERER